MPTYDELNANISPTKSVFDNQQVGRPAVYRNCGRLSTGIGVLCLLAEIGVFILKRGLTTMGIGIWTGATSVVLGAVTMAVPKTRTVCSVNTCFCAGLVSMAVSAAGAAVCVVHIARLYDIVNSEATPRPNFELTCPTCGHLLMLKEACQIGVLLLQFLVSAALVCFAHSDCLCCRDTETEVILSAGSVGAAPVVTENQNVSPSPSMSLRQSQSAIQRQASLQQQQQASCSSAAGAGLQRNYSAAPMLYDL